MGISFESNLTIALLSYCLKINGKKRIFPSLKDLAFCKLYHYLPDLMLFICCALLSHCWYVTPDTVRKDLHQRASATVRHPVGLLGISDLRSKVILLYCEPIWIIFFFNKTCKICKSVL